LSRVGFDKTLGYLQGGLTAWQKAGKPVDTVESITAVTFKERLKKQPPVYDVRKETEYDAEHLKEAHLTPLDFLNDHLAEFPSDKTFYLHCALKSYI